MSITASMVKELRERTGAGMMDCKKALSESGGALDAAADWLREKGLSAAAKKSGRTAAEGLVGVYTEGTRGAICEVNAETDFVARNKDFQEYVSNVAKIALDANDDVASLAKLPYTGSSRDVSEELTQLIATIGENMNLRRVQSLSVGSGIVTSYVHNKVNDGLGNIGVLVALETSANASDVSTLAYQLAMHIAAAAPQVMNISDVSTEVIEKERKIINEQALASGEPEAAIEQTVERGMKKFYKETALMEQAFIMDSSRSVAQVIADASKDFGTEIKLAGFVRFALGEGLEKKTEDFASEVAAQLKQ